MSLVRQDLESRVNLLRRFTRRPGRTAAEATALVAAAVVAFPLYWMVLSAFKPAGEIRGEPRPWTLAPTLDSFRRESSLRTWLFTILRRLHLDRRRAARRAAADVSVDDVDLATEHGALDEVVAEETRGRLDRVVQGLTRMQREVFTLRVSEGLSYKEIADVLGSTEGAARVHYHNALRAVKEALDD